MQKIRIDGVKELALGDARVFEFEKRGKPAQGFLLHHNEGFSAYRNQCCHWPVPLDLGDGDFYYAAIDRITCKTHGATYLPATGECDSGPCAGARLKSYEIEWEGDTLWVRIPEDA